MIDEALELARRCFALGLADPAARPLRAEAIAALRRARAALGRPDPDVEIAFGLLLSQDGDDQAVPVLAAVAAGADAGSEAGAISRLQLAALLRARFLGTGSRADIEDAIGHAGAVLAAFAGDPDIWWQLVELYFFRAAATRDARDVDEMITAGLDALGTMAPGTPERALVAAATGLILADASRGSEASGGPDHLDRVIAILGEARDGLAADSPLRPAVVRELGVMIVARAEAGPDPDGLRTGIALLTEAMGLFPDGDQNRAETAGALGNSIVRAADCGLPDADLDLAVALLTSRRQEDIADPGERGSWLDTAGLAYMARARSAGQPADLDRGIDCHSRALRAYPREHPGYARAASNLAQALRDRYAQRQDLADLDTAIAHLDRLIASLEPWSPPWREAQLNRGECVLSRPGGTLGRDESERILALSRQLTGELPAGHPQRPRYLHNLILALLLRLGRDHDDADAASAATLAADLAGCVPAAHLDRAALLTTAAIAMWTGGRLAGAGDVRSRVIGYLTEAVAASAPEDPARGRRLAALGIAILTPPGHRPADPLPGTGFWSGSGLTAGLAAGGLTAGGLTAAERDLAMKHLDEAARLLARTPGGALTAAVMLTLARLRRVRADPARDDRAQARGLGLAALAEHGYQVFLQSATADALDRARTAAADAAEVAAWCLADGAAAAAVLALESGRGLVLHAATSATDVASCLREAGEHGLAREWSRLAWSPVSPVSVTSALAPDYVPAALRQRVLAALAGVRPRPAPLAPPVMAEITRALERGGYDALAYLLPATVNAPGAAVIVRPRGEVVVLPLPDLADLAVSGARLGDPDRLDDITAWAGPAVAGPLLAAVGPGSGGGPPRVVLVPLGALGAVPWHAARMPDGPALRRAVFSYAASARQLGEAVTRPRRPWRQAPAFVVNPRHDLPWASAEARAIRAAHCPDAAFFGDLAEGQVRDAGPDDVLSLLPGPGTPGASLLHVGCHSRAAGSPLDAALMLDTGQELTAGQILAQAAARPADAAGGLVVLATCRSDLTTGPHDEALTLATTFLSAGAASVIGTRREVYDAQSAVLMFMTYEFLASGYGRPADALRAAQLWMLDPDRAIPASMPEELAGAAGRLALDDIAAWAGFVHHGW